MIVDWCVLKIWSVEVLERIMLTSSSRFDNFCPLHTIDYTSMD